tara:strand:- start:113 stop:481 length:369 start_codon:yes stop_codon:yes gene_type:complete
MEDLDFRMRLLEDRYSKVRDRLILMNQNMIDEFKLFNDSFETLTEEMRLMRKDLDEVKEVTRNLLRTSKQFADKKKVKVLEKYINLWNPLNFVTEKEVQKLIEVNTNSRQKGRGGQSSKGKK